MSGGFGESGFKKFMYYCDKAENILDNLNQKKEEDDKGSSLSDLSQKLLD